MSFTFSKHQIPLFSRSLVVITLVGFLLRVLAARGELWLDEIWSLTLLEEISSWHEVFWKIPNVNNHTIGYSDRPT